MKIFKLVFSREAPNVRDVIWAKPEANSFSLHLSDNGAWKHLEAPNTNNVAISVTDLTSKFSAKADKVSNATNGHLAALNSKGNLSDSGKKVSDFALLGSVEDAPNTMTLNGLKAYIDEKIAELKSEIKS